MHECNCTAIISSINKNCDCPTIEKVNSMKYLGIFVDEYVKWYIHIEYLCSRLKYLIYNFYKINEIKDINVIRKNILCICSCTFPVLYRGMGRCVGCPF